MSLTFLHIWRGSSPGPLFFGQASAPPIDEAAL
jgi:hypothetical protein